MMSKMSSSVCPSKCTAKTCNLFANNFSIGAVSRVMERLKLLIGSGVKFKRKKLLKKKKGQGSEKHPHIFSSSLRNGSNLSGGK